MNDNGLKLKKLRGLKGLKQKDLAKMLNVSEAEISHLEKRIDIAAKEMIYKIKNGKKKDFSKAVIKQKEDGGFEINF